MLHKVGKKNGGGVSPQIKEKRKLNGGNCGICMYVPGTVKHFLWRVENNLMPTRANLYINNVIDSPCCQVC